MYDCIVYPAFELVRALYRWMSYEQVFGCVAPVGSVGHNFPAPSIFDYHFDKVALWFQMKVLSDVGGYQRTFETDIVPVFIIIEISEGCGQLSPGFSYIPIRLTLRYYRNVPPVSPHGS